MQILNFNCPQEVVDTFYKEAKIDSWTKKDHNKN